MSSTTTTADHAGTSRHHHNNSGDNNNVARRPADNLIFKDQSLIDNVYSSRAKKRPAWLTSTHGSETTLFSISKSGRLKENAIIHWASSPNDGSGSSSAATTTRKAEVMVEVEGERYPAEKFCKKHTGLTGAASAYSFMAGSLRCQWSPQIPTNSTELWFGTYITWQCFAEEVDPLSRSQSSSRLKTLFKPSSKPSRPKTLLATYQVNVNNSFQDGGLVLYPEGIPLTFFLILSIILFDVKRDTWKMTQSKRRPEEVETMLMQDAHGDLPTYNPDSSRTTDVHPTVQTTTPWRWSTQTGQGQGRSLERNSRSSHSRANEP
ncbi:hypothetical protein FRC17_007678 [Serendipita sp. 399]|nr:hypothetical protein FRC17_007678 [Serendipita sp. 399]